MKYSELFDLATQNPWVPGIYEVFGPNGEPLPYPFHKWDGKGWLGVGATPDDCVESIKRDTYREREKPRSFYIEGCRWRGLSSPTGE